MFFILISVLTCLLILTTLYSLLLYKVLAATYAPTGLPLQYHRRWRTLLLSSKRYQVLPLRHYHQNTLFNLQFTMYNLQLKSFRSLDLTILTYNCQLSIVNRQLHYLVFQNRTDILNLLVLLLRKEVIQPHLPVRLPCYDFTPLTRHTFGTDKSATSGASNSGGVTGGVYKARERIHRGVLIHDY